ncbi:hypothetical protein E4U54_000237 [Claviceps lovelessii]|nr:hypothetical protein E4U54_000237 [Claviceps lovelessii]
MASHETTARLPGAAESKAGLSTSETRVTRPRPSLEAGRSSTSAESSPSVAAGVPAAGADANSVRQDDHHHHQQQQPQQQTEPSPAQTDDSASDSLQRGASTRRTKKPKSSGGFLLHNPFSGKLRPAARGSIRSLFQTNGKTNGKASIHLHTPQSLRSNAEPSLLQSTSPSDLKIFPHETSASPESTAGQTEGSGQGGRLSRAGSEQPMTTRKWPRSSDDIAGDVDSTQIVQMALNLSESRRMASRRHVSRATPPRLSPLPDSSPGSKLRQHLQQQRKSSLNSSPKSKRAPSPRISSSGRRDSSLQVAAGFESAHDGHYRYQFSSSTLARAAKAKEHLELMAQYRRLLDVLPPLKAGFGPHLTTSPPGSPVGNKPGKFGHAEYHLPLGRQYNPLQFIRNRKVRARERKIIDGEKQGFGDVEFVRLWVDRVVERATSFATNPDDDEGDCIMPKYPYADDTGTGVAQASTDHLSKASSRVRRPRVDWFVEPCDIMADAYWLEQENHKELIEDRHWRKIFPPKTALSRTMSRETAVDFDAIPPFSMHDDDGAALDSQTPGIFKVDSGLSHNSAKDRAKQTLHNIRAFPHRHHGQNMASDFMWHKKDSTSDISGSESDRRRVPQTPPSAGQEADAGASFNNMSRILTEEQVSDMVAKDARMGDRIFSGARSDPEPGHLVSTASRKLSERNPLSLPPTRFHSRKGSAEDTSDSDRKPTAIEELALGSPVRHHVPGRRSLDVSDGSRGDFVGYDYSLSTSPELRPTRESIETVSNARVSSSWSRSGSPHRNPISKFKQIMREKGGNHHKFGGPQEDDHRGECALLEASSPEKSDLPEDHKSTGVEQVRRGMGNTLLRSDDAAGRRGIFKAGPRLETAFRGGVSRLGDMLWKREGVGGEQSADMETTDDSDNEKDRGRSRLSASLSRKLSKRRLDGQEQPEQQFLDIPPVSHLVPGGANHSSSANASQADLASGSASHGQQSGQVFDTLRQPQIDARSASTSAPLENRQTRAMRGSDASDSVRQGGSGGGATDDVRDADKGHHSPPHVSRPGGDVPSSRSRQWSIADIQGTPTEDTRLTRREIARMRALVLSTGIKAMEICRRAQELQKPFCADAPSSTDAASGLSSRWAETAKLCPEATQPLGGRQANHMRVAFSEMYVFAGRSLSAAIQISGRRWQASADHFTYRTSPQLQNRIGDVRSRIADDLSEQSRQASDLADETNRDLALGQPLKVKAVVDTIEKMFRRRRRRLRWVRRALWLTVEWLLVGFMWYVWAMVMILRVFLGIGKGFVKSARWLLWL